MQTAKKSYLTQRARTKARQLLAERPEVVPGTCTIIDSAAAKKWFDLVCAAAAKLDIEAEPRAMSEFCDIAGVPD